MKMKNKDISSEVIKERQEKIRHGLIKTGKILCGIAVVAIPIVLGVVAAKEGESNEYLEEENSYLKEENRRLHNLCEEKDSYFMELMSDGLRHGSALAAQHMADRKNYINGK